MHFSNICIDITAPDVSKAAGMTHLLELRRWGEAKDCLLYTSRGAARGLKHQQDKPRPVEQVQIGDVFHILEAAGDVVRLLENIHVDGDGQCNQRQIDENGEPALLFPRSQLARRDEEQDVYKRQDGTSKG